MWPFHSGAMRYIAVVVAAVVVASMIAKSAAESAVDAKLKEKYVEPPAGPERGEGKAAVAEPFVAELNSVIDRLRALSAAVRKDRPKPGEKNPRVPEEDESPEDNMEHFVSGVQDATSLHANAFPYRRI